MSLEQTKDYTYVINEDDKFEYMISYTLDIS